MKILNDDSYEEMACAFQCFQIQTLYNTLKQNKVPEKTIRKICEDFTHSFGTGIDQFWLDSEEEKVFPVVGFTKKHWQYNPSELYLNNEYFSFSEYAFGNISWFFEENEPDSSPQIFGNVDDNGNPA